MPNNDPTYSDNDAKTWLLGFDLRELKAQLAKDDNEAKQAEAGKNVKAAENLGAKPPHAFPKKKDEGSVVNSWGDIWTKVDG